MSFRQPLLFSAFALTFATAGCGDRDGTIRFLRSEGYTFSNADRRVIGRIIEPALTDVRPLLPDLPEVIDITVRPGDDVIAETGETGAAMPPAAIMWTVDASRAGGVQAVAKAWLRPSLFHEFHHLVRSAAVMPTTLVDHAIHEGIATVFERDFAGVKPPWGNYPDDVEEWSRELRALPGATPTGPWLYTHPDGRRWIGIKVGAFWVDRVTKRTGQTSADLATAPTADVLRLSQ